MRGLARAIAGAFTKPCCGFDVRHQLGRTRGDSQRAFGGAYRLVERGDLFGPRHLRHQHDVRLARVWPRPRPSLAAGLERIRRRTPVSTPAFARHASLRRAALHLSRCGAQFGRREVLQLLDQHVRARCRRNLQRTRIRSRQEQPRAAQLRRPPLHRLAVKATMGYEIQIRPSTRRVLTAIASSSKESMIIRRTCSASPSVGNEPLGANSTPESSL